MLSFKEFIDEGVKKPKKIKKPAPVPVSKIIKNGLKTVKKHIKLPDASTHVKAGRTVIAPQGK